MIFFRKKQPQKEAPPPEKKTAPPMQQSPRERVLTAEGWYRRAQRSLKKKP